MKKTLMAVLITGVVLAVSGAALFGGSWRPRLPVAVSYPMARLDSHLKAQIHNDSDRARKVLLVMEIPSTGQTMRKMEIIPARSMVEVDGLEGWRFISGQHVRAHPAGDRDDDRVVP